MSYEDGFVHLANRIEPDDGLRNRVLALEEHAPKRRKKPVLKYAVSFALVAAVLAGGSLCWPMQPVRKNMGSLSVAVPQTGFTVVANAATTGGSLQSELRPGREFQMAEETDGTSAMGEGHGDSTKDEEMAIAGFRLKCIGNDIEKVTYQTNRGEFQKLVGLNVIQKAYYQSFHHLPGSDADLKWASPNSAYSPVGAMQEVGPDSDGMLYLKEQETITDLSSEEIEYDLKYTTKIQKRLFDGTKIKISVLFKNGTRSEKTVSLTYPDQEPNGFTGGIGYMTASIVQK